MPQQSKYTRTLAGVDYVINESPEQAIDWLTAKIAEADYDLDALTPQENADALHIGTALAMASIQGYKLDAARKAKWDAMCERIETVDASKAQAMAATAADATGPTADA